MAQEWIADEVIPNSQGRTFSCNTNVISYMHRGLHKLSMDTKNSIIGGHMNF